MKTTGTRVKSTYLPLSVCNKLKKVLPLYLCLASWFGFPYFEFIFMIIALHLQLKVIILN